MWNFVSVMKFVIQGRGHWRAMAPTSTSKPKKVQQFQFQTPEILLFMGVQKLYGPRNFTISVYATIFGQFVAAFHFFPTA